MNEEREREMERRQVSHAEKFQIRCKFRIIYIDFPQERKYDPYVETHSLERGKEHLYSIGTNKHLSQYQQEKSLTLTGCKENGTSPLWSSPLWPRTLF